MKRTNLVWDNYIDYLIDAINGSKFMKRAENKPMATPKTPTESHISTRSIHLRESADIAKRIAKGLGLNEDFIYASMLMHDAGHPFSAHEGEEIFSQLGDVFDTQYFHHNAKGVEIIMSEDICGKAINKIPNIENNPELRKQLEEEFPYFLDVIISHDGEANQREMTKAETPYETIQEAVRTKMSLANGINNYKFIAQTPEGKIAKFADVIAYLASDMQDGFRLGIINDFDDDYLEFFGEIFSQDYPGTSREEKIECGRRIIGQIKEQNLREKIETVDFMDKQDEDLKNALVEIGTRIREEGLNIYNESDIAKIQEVVAQEQEKLKTRKLDQFFNDKGENVTEEQRKALEEEILRKSEEGKNLDKNEKDFARILSKTSSEANKIEEYATKMLRARSSTVYEVTSRMKEYFINDLLRNSQNQDTPQFSNATWDLFFKAKVLNYEKYVQYTNWDYQTQELPEAAKALVEECAESLVKSGAIRNKFYDEDARKYVQDENALEYMDTKYRPEEQYISYRKENGIGDLKSYTKPAGKYTGNKQHKLMKLYHDLYSYVENENEVFAIRYENTFNAVKTRVRRKIETALTKNHQADKKHLYRKEVQEQVDNYRQKILDTYGTTSLTDEQKEEFINTEIQTELNDMEYKMAIQLSSDYLAGMSDKTFIDLAIKTEHFKQETVDKAERGVVLSESVKKLVDNLGEEKASKDKKDGEER